MNINLCNNTLMHSLKSVSGELLLLRSKYYELFSISGIGVFPLYHPKLLSKVFQSRQLSILKILFWHQTLRTWLWKTWPLLAKQSFLHFYSAQCTLSVDVMITDTLCNSIFHTVPVLVKVSLAQLVQTWYTQLWNARTHNAPWVRVLCVQTSQCWFEAQSLWQGSLLLLPYFCAFQPMCQ